MYQCQCQCEHDERTIVLTFTPYEWAELLSRREEAHALDTLTGFVKGRALEKRDTYPYVNVRTENGAVTYEYDQGVFRMTSR